MAYRFATATAALARGGERALVAVLAVTATGGSMPTAWIAPSAHVDGLLREIKTRPDRVFWG